MPILARPRIAAVLASVILLTGLAGCSGGTPANEQNLPTLQALDSELYKILEMAVTNSQDDITNAGTALDYATGSGTASSSDWPSGPWDSTVLSTTDPPVVAVQNLVAGATTMSVWATLILDGTKTTVGDTVAITVDGKTQRPTAPNTYTGDPQPTPGQPFLPFPVWFDDGTDAARVLRAPDPQISPFDVTKLVVTKAEVQRLLEAFESDTGSNNLVKLHLDDAVRQMGYALTAARQPQVSTAWASACQTLNNTLAEAKSVVADTQDKVADYNTWAALLVAAAGNQYRAPDIPTCDVSQASTAQVGDIDTLTQNTTKVQTLIDAVVASNKAWQESH